MKEENIKKIKFYAIRKKWDESSNKWYFSIVDIVDIVTESSDPRNYWKVFKNRLNKTQNKLVTQCNQFKLEASDGKFYLTDVADIYTMTEILKILSPSYLLPFKAWALGLNKPKLEKTTHLSIKKMPQEISFKNKNKNYPQVTYTLANLINKKTENTTEQNQNIALEKKFQKVKKMKTI